MQSNSGGDSLRCSPDRFPIGSSMRPLRVRQKAAKVALEEKVESLSQVRMDTDKNMVLRELTR